ncbi:hypothetical protein NQ317_003644 [Molorchus minor]|uniref:Uncharacterized protein n=1 Tax=Molorchus minor TaxID=1323400 RepID=A0ABQ9JHS7_9CUCU|nr:hypothetical protein NQ317_003644 [Molorchus minor]
MDCEHNEKITKVLQKLLDPNFTIKNDVYLNSLLTHLSMSSVDGSKVDSGQNEQMSAWLVEAVSQWEQSEKKPSSQVLSFALNLASVICTDEHTFGSINSNNFCERLIEIVGVNSESSPPTIKLGFIKFIASLVNHKLGQEWIMSTQYWTDIMHITLKNQTIYITKEGGKFFARLLDTSIKTNEAFTYKVVHLMMAPLNELLPHIQQDDTKPLEIKDQVIYQALRPTLKLITQILEINLSGVKDGNDIKLALMFLKTFFLAKRIKNILLIAQNEEFVFDLYNIRLLGMWIKVHETLREKAIFECEQYWYQRTKFGHIFGEMIQKGYTRNVIKLGYMSLIYYKYISSKLPVFVRGGDCQNDFCEIKMLSIEICPIQVVSLYLLGRKEIVKAVSEDDIRDDFMYTNLKKLTPDTIRLNFQWKHHLMVQPNIFDYAMLALNHLVKAIPFLSRDLAVVVFKFLIYCLRDVITVLKSNPDQLLSLRDHNYWAVIIGNHYYIHP